jgi:triacylglycerol lipase
MAFDAQARSFSQANAQILAQAAAVAYSPPATCEKWAARSGFTGPFDFLDHQDTQGFVAESDDAVLVAFRGTQPNHSMDWFVDAGAVHRPWAHNAGTVHTGFYNALLAVWGVTLGNREVLPQLLLSRGRKTIWMTGHSLGGALAELCAAQAVFVSDIPVQGVYTFGQPRVGSKQFAEAVDASLGSRIFRFINHRDIVPRVPLFSGGYCHYGNNTFFDAAGKSAEQMSAVETLANAFTFGAAVFNLSIVQQAAGAIKLGIGRVLGADTPIEEAEEAFRETARSLLRLGVEKIDDHDMKKHYLVRLGTSLPPDL